MNLKIQALRGDYTPKRAHPDDAGIDLAPPERWIIPPHETLRIPLGVAVAIPDGHVGLLMPRSSFNLRSHLDGRTGVIDAGYRGELQCIIHNPNNRVVVIQPHMPIYQLLVLPVALPAIEILDLVDTLNETERGTDGFGSTTKDHS